MMSRAATQLLREYGVAPRAGWTESNGGIASVTVDQAVRRVAEETRRTRQEDLEARPPCRRVDDEATIELLRRMPVHLFEDQQRAVDAIVDGTTARSGVIKAPCGAGKTHVGLGVARALGERTLVVTPTAEANREWSERLQTMGVRAHLCGTGMALRACDPAAVVIITYKMLARATHLTALDDLAHELVVVGNVWRYGLVIFDEVWTLPAPTYLQSCARVPCRVRVGLTADERRCDGKESVITSFVGPVRHELTLARALETRVVAPIDRRIIVVATTADFRALHARATVEQRRILSVLNPQKMHAFLEVLRTTRRRKVLVFCDKCAAMDHVRDLIGKYAPLPFHGVLSGSTPKQERTRVCAAMKASALDGGVALFSKVGNASIDLPDVDLVIELSVVDQSAQQKTQREGRAQRTHAHKASAEVVTLVSKGTREEHFASKRDGGTSRNCWIERALVAQPDCPWSEMMLACFVDDRKRAQKEEQSVARKRIRSA
jgi:DNA excision repair protein ERCC-3